ncbi:MULTISPECIES: complement resistance protein TraT [unclassified Campylobacter]|uniref:complement resistance protein TraT n=1 Tax=unclassified Campylobacter TaxID=2593542 RepID=UPI001475F75F|nr:MULTISPECIES: complement resistance protein TraT [unclassified Campylobacter]QKG30120.1 putative TraT complement resistance protein [Campylobacter sp. RM16187]
MRYLQILLLLFMAFFFAACSTNSTPKLYLNSSAPVFITNLDANRTVFINFKNSSGHQNTLEETVKKKFVNKGFVPVADKKRADIVILGDFMMLERVERKDPNVFINLGYGFGSFGRRSSAGVGIVFGDPFYDDYYNTRHYIYKATVSVSITTKEREQRTILDVQSDKNVYSPSYIMPFVEDKIATQIINFFY